MTDLRVDYGVLEESERALSRIRRQLESAELYRDELAGAWGSRHLADAMRDFVDNWDRHRRGLLEAVTSVGQMCAGTCATFRAVEQHLGPRTDPP